MHKIDAKIPRQDILSLHPAASPLSEEQGLEVGFVEVVVEEAVAAEAVVAEVVVEAVGGGTCPQYRVVSSAVILTDPLDKSLGVRK